MREFVERSSENSCDVDSSLTNAVKLHPFFTGMLETRFTQFSVASDGVRLKILHF